MSYHPALKTFLFDPRMPPAVAHAKDEEWNDKAGMSGPINGMAAAWTAFGSQGYVPFQNLGSYVMYINSGNIGGNFVGFTKTQPSTPYTVTCEVAITSAGPTNSPDAHAGIGFRNSSDGKMWLLGLFQDPITSGDEYRRVGLCTYRYPDAHAATTFGVFFEHHERTAWLRITNDGSNLSWSWSPTGTEGSYETGTTESYATALVTPDQFIFGLNAAHAGSVLHGKFGPIRVT